MNADSLRKCQAYESNEVVIAAQNLLRSDISRQMNVKTRTIPTCYRISTASHYRSGRVDYTLDEREMLVLNF